MLESIAQLIVERAYSTPTDCSKNSVVKSRNESCCKLDRRRGRSYAVISTISVFLIGWHWIIDWLDVASYVPTLCTIRSLRDFSVVYYSKQRKRNSKPKTRQRIQVETIFDQCITNKGLTQSKTMIDQLPSPCIFAHPSCASESWCYSGSPTCACDRR